MLRVLSILTSLSFALLFCMACDLENTEDSNEIDDGPPPNHGNNPSCDDLELSEEEQLLYRLLMEERLRNNLREIPLSPSLTEVAQTHADEAADHPDTFDGDCNLHSWNTSQYWAGCCYTPDHEYAECMWDKPYEITGFRADGFEIAYLGNEAPETMLQRWLDSPGHRDVILNRGEWSDSPWRSIGVGISQEVEGKRFAYVWFAREKDCD